MEVIVPSLVESFDFAEVVFLSSGNHQGLILDATAVLEDYFALFRDEFFNSNVVR